MANRFSNVEAASGEVEADFTGGGGIFDTDLYKATIKAAYEIPSTKSKSVSMNLLLDIDGREYREQIWMCNGQGGVTYKDKKSGELKNLPGYNQVNSLFMLVLGKEIGQADVEELTLKLYDHVAKAEVPKAVDCYTELHGQEIYVAIQRQTVDKTKDDGNGNYVPTGETRDENEVVKFLPASRQVTMSEVNMHIKSLGGTLTEVLENEEMDAVLESMPDEMGSYISTWLENNKGQTRNRAKGAGKAEGKSFGGGSKKADTGEKKKSLFGK